MYHGPNGTTIAANRCGNTFTIRIYDAEERQIGVLGGIVDIPRGLILAEGYVAGYYAGIVEGNKCMYKSVCAALGVSPSPQAEASIERRVYAPEGEAYGQERPHGG